MNLLEKAKKLAEKAFANNELYDFLIGKGDYYLHDYSGPYPTDTGAVANQVQEFLNSPQAVADLKKALLELSKEAEYGWLICPYLNSFLRRQEKAGQSWLKQEFISDLGDNLKSNQKAWENNRKWPGSGFENGIWGDVERFPEVLMEKYGVNML